MNTAESTEGSEMAHQMGIDEPCYSAAEVAAALRVSVVTIRRWLARGRLEGFRLPNGDYRVPAEAWRRFVASGSQKPGG